MGASLLLKQKDANPILVILMILWMPFEALFKFLFGFIKNKYPSKNTIRRWNSKIWDETPLENSTSIIPLVLGIFSIISVLYFILVFCLYGAYTGAIWAIIPG